MIPKHLKQKENYKPIQERLLKILGRTGHSHPDQETWGNCFPCMLAFNEYKEEKKKLGFHSTSEFMKWSKVRNAEYQVAEELKHV